MVILYALVLTLETAPAQKTEFERYVFAAEQLFEKLEFERAFEQVLKAKGHSGGVKDDVTVALWEGILRAELRGVGDAEAAFRTALLLDPDAKLPVKVSPTVRELFDRVRFESKQAFAEKPPPKPELKALPTDEPLVVAPAPRDTRRWALVPGIAGLLLAGSGTALLLVAQSAHQQLTSGSPGAKGAVLRERGALLQPLGFVGIGVGAAAVAAAIAWLVLGAPAAPVGVAVTPGGASLVWSGAL